MLLYYLSIVVLSFILVSQGNYFFSQIITCMSRIQSFDKKYLLIFPVVALLAPIILVSLGNYFVLSFYQIIICKSGIYQLTTKIAFYSCGECARILHFTNCGSISPVHFGISNRTRGYNINHVGCGMEFMVSLQTFCHCL